MPCSTENWLTFSRSCCCLESEQSTGSLRVRSQRRRLHLCVCAHMARGGSGSHDQFFCNALQCSCSCFSISFDIKSKSLEISSDRAVLCTLSSKGEQKSQVISTKSKSELPYRRRYVYIAGNFAYLFDLKRSSNGQICDTLDLFQFSNL